MNGTPGPAIRRAASAAPAGTLYKDGDHTVLIALAGIVFACDTEPAVATRSPHDWVTLQPRRIEFGNVERLRGIDVCSVVASPTELEAALDIRLKELSLAWNTSSS